MTREMTVSYLARDHFSTAVPMIRIAGRFLREAGFEIGDKIEVQYLDKEVVIKKLI